MEVVLKPNKYKRKRYMQINMIAAKWDRKIRAYVAMVIFDLTRDRPDRKPVGYKLYANNLQTMERMLLDLADLYPPVRKMVVSLPDQTDTEQMWYSRFLNEDEE